MNNQAGISQAEDALAALARQEQARQQLANSLSLIGFDDDYLVAHFRANLQCLEHYFPDLARFFQSYKPKRYFIDVVNGRPNIFDAQQRRHIYADDSFLYALSQYNEFLENPHSTHGRLEIDEVNRMSFIHVEHLNELVKIERSLSGDASGELPAQLGQVLLFGAGLGFHTELLVNNHQIRELHVIEPDLDLFYASLFVTAWFHLLPLIDARGGSLHFNLGDGASEAFDEILKLGEKRGYYKAALAYTYVHYLTPELESLISKYKERYFELVSGWGFYDDAVIAIAHQGLNLDNNVPLLRTQAPQALAEVPVFVCANGPSLDKAIDFIRQHQDKALIVSGGSSLRSLVKYGITPDIHCEQERLNIVADLLDNIGQPELLAKLNVMAPGSVTPEVFKRFGRGLMVPKSREASSAALMELEGFKVHFEVANFLNPTVTNTGLRMLSAMGFRNFYLFGVDLGYPSGEHHSKNSFYFNEKGQDKGIFTTNDEMLVAGNRGGQVATNPIFNLSRRRIEGLLKVMPELNCYNFGEGALIEGAESCQLGDKVPTVVLDKASLVDGLYQAAAEDNQSQRFAAPYWQLFAPEVIDEAIDTLLAILDHDVTSREQAGNMMDAVFAQLIAWSNQGRFHLAEIFEGSMNYYQSVLCRIAYAPVDTDRALTDFNKAKGHYMALFKAIPAHYRRHYRIVDPIALASFGDNWNS
ncbi:6-hydroxymethylpterin diphosphokinase MptE-like protein [Gallaecimonas xiamenensis]|uniref:DUF115 domain-containing protein n=1 Tax=Gallaecimonas xiamenensis 3-C-1 TaxID=745411 RepID=K2JJE5_9GAMM|nr:6-hydroxymethylpterin diphosphokinase MptE-like protein [Gallaecimonas xiamenensis]EKE75438.1 hypothetical protein B3C1_07169 [Gallaecimonas xiamenensis 3-C-1]